MPTEIGSLYEKWANSGKTPDFPELVDALISIARHFSRVWLFLDALDECDKTKQRVDLLSAIQRLMKANTCISGFATGRSCTGDIGSAFEDTWRIELLARRTDIESFVRCKVSVPICDKRLVEKIVSEISKGVDGMYVIYIRPSILNIRLISYV